MLPELAGATENCRVPIMMIAAALLLAAGCAGQRSIDIAPAVAAVDRFQAALVAGDLAAAAAELDPEVLILESGGAEYSAAEYLAGHAKSDAEFLKTARIRPTHRAARLGGDLAWVASVSEMEIQKGGQPVTIDGVETMVLERGPSGWKIVHIHWSSRTRR